MLLDFYLYNFNWRFLDQEWGLTGLEGAYVAPKSLVDLFAEQYYDSKNCSSSNEQVQGDDSIKSSTGTCNHRYGPNNEHVSATTVRRIFRRENRAVLIQLAMQYNIVFWTHAGWHLSQFYSPAQMSIGQISAYPPKQEKELRFWSEETCKLVQVGRLHSLLF
jgi:hypothetical protein